MTRFILAGGNDKRVPEGKNFYLEMLNGTEPIRMLQCVFSRPVDTWLQTFEEDVDFIREKVGKNIDAQLAQRDTFIQQLDWADVVFFRGGETTLLLDAMRSYPDWLQHVQGKTVAGSSAGAHMLTTYHYGLHSLKVEKGLGILPLKVIVHYDSDFNAPHVQWEKALAELKAYGEELPVVVLKEGEHRTYEQ